MTAIYLFSRIAYFFRGFSRPTPAELVYLPHLDGKPVRNVPPRDPYWKGRLHLKTGRAAARLARFGLLEAVCQGEQRVYQLTHAGRAALEENRHLLYLDDLNLGGDPVRVDLLRQSHPGSDEYDVAREVISRRMASHRKAREWGRYRDDLVMQASNCGQQGDYGRMLFYLFQVCWFDANGRGIPGFCGQGRDARKGTLVPGILGMVEYAARKSGLSWQELSSVWEQSQKALPPGLCAGRSVDGLWQAVRGAISP